MAPRAVRKELSRKENVFRAVADPTRREMLDLLRGQDRSVTELAKPFRMSQPAISQHLRVLRGAGLVRARRSGRRRLYRVNPKALEDVVGWVSKQLKDPFGHVWSFRSAQESGSERAGETLPRGAGTITHAKTTRLAVRDQRKAFEFYTRRLGFEVRRDEPLRGRAAGARRIEVAPKGAQTTIELVREPSGSRDRIGAVTGMVFSCRDVEETYQEMAARGVKFTQKPTHQSRDLVQATFQDPDGNAFALVGEES